MSTYLVGGDPDEYLYFPEVLREYPRIVLLGDPGAGKTTLLRHLCLQFASSMRIGLSAVRDAHNVNYGDIRLPIPIRIATYADAFAKNRNLSLREFASTAFGELDVTPKAMAALFTDALNEGRALVLLDGLDEIIDPSDRGQVARRIEEFVAAANQGNRFVITSRIAGYRSAPITGDFLHLTLRELSHREIGIFLQQWCTAIERFQTPDAAEAEVANRAAAEVRDILRTVDGNEGVRRLAGNPLTLTILALIHRAGARLPSRRVELYELATKTLLEDWELARGISSTQVVREGEALRLLGPLAYWLHENKPSGMAGEQEVRHQLACALGATRNLPVESADVQDAVDDFLRRVREHTGVFVERAPSQYGFMHLTFEEYFVARELVRRRADAVCRINRHRHQARWEEPILLAIGFVSEDYPEDATDIIRTAILAEGQEAAGHSFAPSSYEQVLHRDLLLAARCIGDVIGLDAVFTQRVVRQMLDLYLDTDRTGRYKALRARILFTLECLRGSDADEESARFLLSKLQDPAWRVRRDVATALGCLTGTPPVILALATAFRSDTHWGVRKAAAEALGSLTIDPTESDYPCPEIEARQMTLVEEEGDGWSATSARLSSANTSARLDIMDSLIEVGFDDPCTVEAVVTCLSDADRFVRCYAAATLGRIGATTHEVLLALEGAVNDKNVFVRLRAAGALAEMDRMTAKAADTIVQSLNDERGIVRRYAKEMLRGIEDAPAEAQRVLAAAIMGGDTDLEECMLANIDLKDVTSELIPALIVASAHERPWIRAWALDLLDRVAIPSREIITILASGLKDKAPMVRRQAVVGLGRIGTSVPEAVEDLVKALDDGDEEVGQRAVVALGRLCNHRAPTLAAWNLEILIKKLHGILVSLASQLPAHGEGDFSYRAYYGSNKYNTVWGAFWVAVSLYDEKITDANGDSYDRSQT